MDDCQIIELYWARDERAIAETNRQYGGYCFGIANQILQDEVDAEECVNDTWLNTWDSIPPNRPTRFRLFLGKITRNLSINRYKEKHREKRGGGETALILEEIEGVLADTRDVESEIERGEFVGLLNRFLKSLPVREREIFVRRYFWAESTAEIARRYGVKESNVLVILSRTRSKLRKVLEKEGYVL